MRKNGFTLLELIIVVVILGILASFALPRYFRQVERARGTSALQLIGTIRSAQIIRRAEQGAYSATNPCSEVELDVDFAVPLGFAAPVCLAPAAVGGTIVRITRTAPPANPINTAELYTLCFSGDGTITCTGGGAAAGGSCETITGAVRAAACP